MDLVLSDQKIFYPQSSDYGNKYFVEILYRLLMEELVKGLGRGSKSKPATHWKDPQWHK